MTLLPSCDQHVTRLNAQNQTELDGETIYHHHNHNEPPSIPVAVTITKQPPAFPVIHASQPLNSTDIINLTPLKLENGRLTSKRHRHHQLNPVKTRERCKTQENTINYRALPKANRYGLALPRTRPTWRVQRRCRGRNTAPEFTLISPFQFCPSI
ncbi:hypothetical protein LXL04_025907 [Taraxacum kok-saghyz]